MVSPMIIFFAINGRYLTMNQELYGGKWNLIICIWTALYHEARLHKGMFVINSKLIKQ